MTIPDSKNFLNPFKPSFFFSDSTDFRINYWEVDNSYISTDSESACTVQCFSASIHPDSDCFMFTSTDNLVATSSANSNGQIGPIGFIVTD